MKNTVFGFTLHLIVEKKIFFSGRKILTNIIQSTHKISISESLLKKRWTGTKLKSTWKINIFPKENILDKAQHETKQFKRSSDHNDFVSSDNRQWQRNAKMLHLPIPIYDRENKMMCNRSDYRQRSPSIDHRQKRNELQFRFPPNWMGFIA